MSNVGFYMDTGEIYLTAATALTVISIFAASNHRAIIKTAGIFFKGKTVGNEPVTVELVRTTNAGTGTAAAPVKKRPDDSETLQTDFVTDCSVEPTGPTVLRTWYIHPQGGMEQVLPFDEPWEIIGGGFLTIRCKADEAVVVGISLEGAE